MLSLTSTLLNSKWICCNVFSHADLKAFIWNQSRDQDMYLFVFLVTHTASDLTCEYSTNNHDTHTHTHTGCYIDIWTPDKISVLLLWQYTSQLRFYTLLQNIHRWVLPSFWQFILFWNHLNQISHFDTQTYTHTHMIIFYSLFSLLFLPQSQSLASCPTFFTKTPTIKKRPRVKSCLIEGRDKYRCTWLFSWSVWHSWQMDYQRSMSDSRPISLRFQLGHLQVGELYW